jgi:hypothetical protein
MGPQWGRALSLGPHFMLRVWRKRILLVVINFFNLFLTSFTGANLATWKTVIHPLLDIPPSQRRKSKLLPLSILKVQIIFWTMFRFKLPNYAIWFILTYNAIFHFCFFIHKLKFILRLCSVLVDHSLYKKYCTNFSSLLFI